LKLYILRHAKTEQGSKSGKDFDRDLKAEGIKQVDLMRSFFLSNYGELDLRIYCSSAKRTRSTLNELESIFDTKKISFHDELYLPSLKQLQQFLWDQLDKSQHILLIGHNSGLSELCTYISGEETLLPTCGLVVYDFPSFSNINEISKETGVEIDRYFPQP
jgi:phosphohistidine phosphatase